MVRIYVNVSIRFRVLRGRHVAPVRWHKGHGEQLGRLALGRFAAAIIFSRGGDVGMARQVGLGRQVGAGVKQRGNPGAPQVVWGEGGSDAGGRRPVLQNLDHGFIAKPSRK
jgi:hypothetical protein